MKYMQFIYETGKRYPQPAIAFSLMRIQIGENHMNMVLLSPHFVVSAPPVIMINNVL